MANPIHLDPAHQAEYDEIMQHLQEKHIRITDSRRAIVSYIIMSNEHPSAEMIYQNLLPHCPNMSLATVYNNLRLLVEEGFVTELKRSNDTTTYFDYKGHDHVNLICESCGKILDLHIPLPSIATEIAEQTGFVVTKEQFTVHGICPSCQLKA